MLTFKEFITEEKQVPMIGTGYKAPRHLHKYVKHAVGSETPTHLMHRAAPNIDAGEKVRIHDYRVDDKGKHFLTISKGDGSHKQEVPMGHLSKPRALVHNKGAAGFRVESELASHLKKHGLMDPNTETAGNTGGVDFHILSKKHKAKIQGSETHEIGGESKISLSAKMGAVSLRHSDEKGWHVSPNSAKKKPHFAAAVEKATVNGKPFLQHLNDHWGPEDRTQHKPAVRTDSTDLHPVHAYLKDHGVDLLHIHSHGTYRGGESEKKDRYNTGLPTPTGTGRFTAGRERAGGSIQVEFRPHAKGFEKSHVDIMKDAHAKQLAKRLGH